MTAHSVHPDTHDYGLADDCARCSEHAKHPFESLDAENLRKLFGRVRDGLPARSVNERRAMDVLEHAQRHASQLRAMERGSDDLHEGEGLA